MSEPRGFPEILDTMLKEMGEEPLTETKEKTERKLPALTDAFNRYQAASLADHFEALRVEIAVLRSDIEALKAAK